MPSLTRVAVHNLVRTPRRSAMISAAVVVGCAAMIFMHAMNNGFADMLITNSTGLMLGHVQVDAADGARTLDSGPVLAAAAQVPEIAGAAPRLEVPALVGAIGTTRGAVLLGVDAAREAAASTFPTLVVEGRFPSGGDSIALGVDLARAVHAKVGDALPVAYLDAADAYQKATLPIVGLIRTGSEELDAKLALVPIATARRLFDEDATTGAQRIVVKARTNALADDAAARLRSRLDARRYRVRTWREVSPFLAGLVAYQYGSINVVLLVMYVIVGAGVAAIQVMGVLERTREFGVLSAIGFTPSRVVLLIALETLFLGVVAVAAGVLFGSALVSFVNHAGGLDVRLAGGDHLEGLMGLDPHLRPVGSLRGTLAAIGLVVPVLLLGGLLPALRAARMTPMEALRRT